VRRVSPTKRAASPWDMLARLAVFYLTASPGREGLLIRERSRSFAKRVSPGTPWPHSTGRDDVRAWVMHQRDVRLAAVGGNEALLRSRRADAVWLDITDRQRPLVEVHEIKVSRADLVSELRQPEKSAVWMRQSHRFWLTVPDPALIDGLALPQEWGVLALPSRSIPVVVRAAPPLTPQVAVRRDLSDYVHHNAETRWRFDGVRFRAVAGRYTVASRLRIGDGQRSTDP
jgi:hypothetical protein